ncbi:hypothetical protein Tco_1047592 [Tanacetum coccineum]
MLVQGSIQQGEWSTVPVELHHTPTSAPSTSHPPTSTPSMQTTYDTEESAIMPHDSSHLRKVEELQSDLKLTKLTYGAAYTKLIMRVKKLEHKIKSSQSRRRARVVISDTEILIDQEEPIKLVEDLGSGEKGKKEISTDNIPVSTASAIPEVSTAGPSSSTSDVFEDEMMTIAESLVAIRRTRTRTTSVVIHDLEEEPRIVPEPTTQSHSSYKDKGKEKMIELDEPVKIKRRDQKRVVQEEASQTAINKELDDIQAMIEVDEQMAARLQSEEQEKYTIEEKARMLAEMIAERKEFFAA